jgi:hypothetical protein
MIRDPSELTSPGRVIGTPCVRLHWIPLGAGGAAIVRSSGRVYEALRAARERRPRLDLYHTALEVTTPEEGRFIIENAWPSPDNDLESRGVVLAGPVFIRRVRRLRILRYEVRCWRDGVIPDAAYAVASPHISSDADLARRLLEMACSVPTLAWGRDESGVGEMWNSNSVISWLLARCGFAADEMEPPPGGRAPGWKAGVIMAQRRDGP